MQTIPTINILATVGNVLSTVQDAVVTTLENEFILGTTTKLGVAKRISALTERVENTAGVDYHHLVLKIYKELTANYDSYYDYGELLEAVPLLPEAVEVYVGESRVSIDDGAGNFVADSTGYIVTGTVNYTTGAVGVDITPTPTQTVSIRYRQDSNGDIEVTNRQICKLHSVDVVGIAYAT